MPRTAALNSVLSPVIDQFVQQLAAAIERFTTERIGAEERVATRTTRAGRIARRGAKGASRRASIRCYFPGCKNVAAPRFGMFCAAAHKKLSKAEKEKYRAQHQKKAA